jgi:hypothetical protein
MTFETQCLSDMFTGIGTTKSFQEFRNIKETTQAILQCISTILAKRSHLTIMTLTGTIPSISNGGYASILGFSTCNRTSSMQLGTEFGQSKSLSTLSASQHFLQMIKSESVIIPRWKTDSLRIILDLSIQILTMQRQTTLPSFTFQKKNKENRVLCVRTLSDSK